MIMSKQFARELEGPRGTPHFVIFEPPALLWEHQATYSNQHSFNRVIWHLARTIVTVP